MIKHLTGSCIRCGFPIVGVEQDGIRAWIHVVNDQLVLCPSNGSADADAAAGPEGVFIPCLEKSYATTDTRNTSQ